MIRTFLLSLMIMMLGMAYAYAQEEIVVEEDAGIVRGLVWGVTPSMVLQYEQAELFGEEKNTLFYLDAMWGFKSLIGYEFSDDGLWRVRVFNEKDYRRNPPELIADMLKIQQNIADIYGEPTVIDFKWLDDKEKNYPEFWGWALYRGELDVVVQWDLDETEITMRGFAEEIQKPQVVVDFIHKKRRPVEETKKLF